MSVNRLFHAGVRNLLQVGSHRPCSQALFSVASWTPVGLQKLLLTGRRRFAAASISSSESMGMTDRGKLDQDELANDDVEQLDIHPDLLSGLQRRFGVSKLYPVQSMCFHKVREGKDVIAKSKTGTGKTLAFVLPIADKILKERPMTGRGCATAVIIAPTRELARQVGQEIEKLSSRLSVAVVYGGAPYHAQVEQLRSGVDFLVATPGRLVDFINQQTIKLDESAYLVLDEADEMLKIGFKNELEEIVRAANNPDRQTMLFSATVPPWVTDISRRYMKNADMIDASGDDAKNQHMSPKTITHKAMCCSPGDMPSIVSALIHQQSSGRVIVFCARKTDVDQLVNSQPLRDMARGLHGDVTQGNRERIMKEFKRGTCRVLCATDVAARGVDIPDVELVIQTFFPDDVETYVHRSGRTGRAGKTGTSIILHSPSDRPNLMNFASRLGSPVYPLFPPRAAHLDERERVSMLRKIRNLDQKPAQAAYVQLAIEATEAVADGKEANTGKEHLELVARLLFELYGGTNSPRSLLSSKANYTTVEVSRCRSSRQAREVLEKTLNSDSIPFGLSEIFLDSKKTCHTYIDIPDSFAAKLHELGSVQGVSIPTDLDPGLYTHNVSNMASNNRNNARGRGGGGGNQGYSNRGGYGGGFKGGNQGYSNRGGYGGGGGGYQGDRYREGGGGYGGGFKRGNQGYSNRGGYGGGEGRTSGGGGGNYR